MFQCYLLFCNERSRGFEHRSCHHIFTDSRAWPASILEVNPQNNQTNKLNTVTLSDSDIKWLHFLHSYIRYNLLIKDYNKAIQVPHRPQQIAGNEFWTKGNNSWKSWSELRRKWNLICNSSYGSSLPNFIQICESIAENSPENELWTKGNNSWKSRSIVTKVELYL